MKALRWLVLACALTACTTTGATGGSTNTAITIAKECADQATHVAAINLVGDVGSDLSQVNWSSLLDGLAVRWGVQAVICAVEEVVGESTHNAQASGDKLSSLKATRGAQWLATHPIPVTAP